eukprot:9786362-Ditylum_brightwellii.AAC.1
MSSHTERLIKNGEVSVNPWLSSECKTLFGVKENEEVDIAIDNMLTILEHGMLGDYGKVVMGYE